MRKAGNKKYLSTFLFMLAMVFVFSARTPQTVQAMSKSTQHKLYKKTMQDYGILQKEFPVYWRLRKLQKGDVSVRRY